MTYVILDLEWNGAFSKKERRFINEIIEFGAVKLDDSLNITDRFSMLVTPQIGKRLSGKISELTHITREELETANNTFMHVASKFGKFAADSVILTWGQSDIHALMENFEYYAKSSNVSFLVRYCDLQTYCADMLGIYDKSKQMGLLTCAEALSIDTDKYELHRAGDDAELSAVCFTKLFDAEKISEYIEMCDAEFYRKMSFRTTYITDLQNPLVDRTKMIFDCPKCGRPAIRKSVWGCKNRHFKADFACTSCGYEFIGKFTFRLKYEGLQITKRTAPKKKEDKKTTPES